MKHMPGEDVVRGGEQLVLLVVLILAVLMSAIGVAYSRFESRQLFVELQQLQKEKDDLSIEWDRLQLEEGTVSTNGIIEKKAREQLNMLLPIFEKVEHVSR